MDDVAGIVRSSLDAGVYHVPDLPDAIEAWGQGLILVHFSAQLEPCLTHEDTLDTLYTPLSPENRLHNPCAHPLSHEKRSS